MTLFWWLVGIGTVAVLYILSLWKAYSYGLKDKCEECKTCKECLEEGYKLGREDVNAHLDAYQKNGGWSV